MSLRITSPPTVDAEALPGRYVRAEYPKLTASNIARLKADNTRDRVSNGFVTLTRAHRP